MHPGARGAEAGASEPGAMMPRQHATAIAQPAAGSVEELADQLAPLPLFARLDRKAQIAIAERCTVAAYRSGATVMQQDEAASFAIVVLDGEIDVFVEIPAGRIHIATVPRHQVVGELAALTGAQRTATVVARTDVVAVRIKREDLVRLTTKYPGLSLSIVQELGRRLNSMNRSLASDLRGDGARARRIRSRDAARADQPARRLHRLCPRLRGDGR